MTLPTAATDSERESGLSGQSEITAMAFAWTTQKRRPVWMADTPMALSAGWIDETGRLTEIMQLAPHDRTIRWSSAPAALMIELPAGGFAARGIRIGDRITRTDCDPTGTRP